MGKINEPEYQKVIEDFYNDFLIGFNKDFELCRVEEQGQFCEDYKQETLYPAFQQLEKLHRENPLRDEQIKYSRNTISDIETLYKRNNKLNTYFEAILLYCDQFKEDAIIIATFDAQFKALNKVLKYVGNLQNDLMKKSFAELFNDDDLSNKYQYKQDKKDYTINTGFIYSQLKKNWKEIDRDFLINVVQEALEAILFDRDIRTVVFDGNNGGYLDNHTLIRFPHYLKIAEKTENFPFPYYFLIPDKNDKIYHSIVCYRESCIVNINEQDFDLFFALQLFVTDLMEIDNFLNFHLQKSFLNNSKAYRRFLDKLCLKYNDFLSKKHEPLLKSFFDDFLKNNTENITVVSEENKLKILNEIATKENKFCKTMPVKYAIDHFMVFTQRNNKDGKPFLTMEQFISFINRAFLNDNSVEKIKLNFGGREKLFVVKRFYEFYYKAIKDYGNIGKDMYIRLLADNFINWSYDNLKNNFGNKVKKQW